MQRNFDLDLSGQAQPPRNLEAPVYPFSAIVGQDEMKTALLLNVVDPAIGGVLILGHRGTAKSTTVRALAQLLPPFEIIADCPFNCAVGQSAGLCQSCHSPRRQEVPVPMVSLPLGATEDRVVGTLDIEAALTQGLKRFEPGLLAKANRGFLYIDEVNLLEDFLVDLLLDVAASGVNLVERESISLSHPARFVLVGSGNPEEGELRPQLLDRFGLFAQITTITDIPQRMEIVRRRERFARDPRGFLAEWQLAQQALQQKLMAARKLAPEIELTDPVLEKIATICLGLEIDGHRGELTIARAGRALAALNEELVVTIEHLRLVAPLALRHRLRRDPLEQIDNGERIAKMLDEVLG